MLKNLAAAAGLGLCAYVGISVLVDGWARMYVHRTRFSLDKIGDLSGKVAIVTGPTIGGLGYISARELARHGAHVVLAGRSPSQGQQAVDMIKAEIGAASNVEYSELDLADLKSVRAFADRFKATGRPLHILMNNAGVMVCPFALTKQGIEMQFGTNHLGHFLLTLLLLPTLKESQPSRVVNTSSGAHYMAAMGIQPFDNIHQASEAGYTKWAAYARSKLANVLFTMALDRRLAGERVYANSLHPGAVSTNLQRHSSFERSSWSLLSLVAHSVFMSPEQGAVTQLFLATSPEVEAGDGIRGRYFHPPAREARPSRLATAEAAEELWALSEKLVADYLK